MLNPSLRKVPPLFLGVILSKTYDSWAGDPIFLGWGPDLFGLGLKALSLRPQILKVLSGI